MGHPPLLERKERDFLHTPLAESEDDLTPVMDLVVDQVEDAISACPSALPFAFFGYQLKRIAQ